MSKRVSFGYGRPEQDAKCIMSGLRSTMRNQNFTSNGMFLNCTTKGVLMDHKQTTLVWEQVSESGIRPLQARLP